MKVAGLWHGTACGLCPHGPHPPGVPTLQMFLFLSCSQHPCCLCVLVPTFSASPCSQCPFGPNVPMIPMFSPPPCSQRPCGPTVLTSPCIPTTRTPQITTRSSYTFLPAGRAAKAATMTAESTEPNGPMREPTVGGTKPSAPPAPPRRRGRRLRRKSLPEVAVKGQLRMRSPSGAFVMVGISVVLVGMTIAVVGYWPHRGHGGAGAGAGNASTAGDMRREVVAGRPTPHNEKLKLIGPVIMGIGLFIFICANTMLYENRDMETRMLMQKGLYCMATDLPKDSSPKDEDTQPAPKASPERLEGCDEVDLSLGSKWADGFGPNRLQTTAELMQCPGASPAASLLSLHSEANLGLSTTVGALALPIIKLNNRLLDAASRGASGMTEGTHPPAEVPAPSRALLSPSSSSSVAPRGLEHRSGHVVVNMEDGGPMVDVGPDAQPHNPGHSKSLDLGRPAVLLVAPIKDRKNRSWPRLDHVNAVAYAKLENWGESLDRLLETNGTPHHAEPRPSSWVVGMEGGSRV
uniref:Transmembrane protein 200B n=1 Tax=Gallus gallus TaxID=9031 RepID=A0A8V0YUU4_CHICK